MSLFWPLWTHFLATLATATSFSWGNFLKRGLAALKKDHYRLWSFKRGAWGKSVNKTNGLDEPHCYTLCTFFALKNMPQKNALLTLSAIRDTIFWMPQVFHYNSICDLQVKRPGKSGMSPPPRNIALHSNGRFSLPPSFFQAALPSFETHCFLKYSPL